MSHLSSYLILGILQGLTEFLPVSSSGHLVLAERGFGFQPDVAVTALLHVGTLLAVLVYFRRELSVVLRRTLAATLTSLGRRDHSRWSDPAARMGLFILLATLPTGVIGLALERAWSWVAAPGFVGACFLVTAFLLWSTRWVRRAGRPLSCRGSLIVGSVQGLAVLPGISRSGSTIAAGLWLGLDRRTAGRFSFLASVPAVAGAGLLEVRHVRWAGGDLVPLLAGTALAFLVGYGALSLLLSQVEKGRMHWYSWYLVVAAAAAFYLQLA